MNDNEKLRQILRKDLDVRAGDGVYDHMLHVVLEEHESTGRTPSAETLTIAGRFVMKKPMIRFAIAAVIVAAVLLGLLEFIGTGSASGVVWAQVAQKVQASRNVVYRCIRHDTPAPLDGGCDFTIEHYTSTQFRSDRYKAGQIIGTMWNDCDTKTVILVDHVHKSYIKVTPENRMPDRFQMDPNSMVQRFVSCTHKELGRKTIDDVLCEGIETTDPAFHGGKHPPKSLTARIWVGVEMGYPVQIEGDYVIDDQNRFTFTQDQFQWDVDLKASLFEPNIPAGYIDISP